MSFDSRVWIVPIVAAVGPAVVGCSGNLGAEQSYSVQRLPDVSKAQAFEAAQLAFRQYFSIERADPAEGALYSRPADVNARGEVQRVRDVMTVTPSRRRQVAELRIEPRGRDVMAFCRVRVQRLDTSELRSFAVERGDDRPSNNAPFDREAGASAAQREAWTDVGRDKALERQILSSLRERLNPQAATAPASGE